MTVLTLSNIDLSHLNVGKRDIIQHSISHFTIKYGEKQQDIVLQTPKIVFQGTPTKVYSGYNQTLCLYNYDCSQETKTFVDRCMELEAYVYEKTKSRIPSDTPPVFQSSFSLNPARTRAYMFVTLKPDISSIFDIRREKKTLDYIQNQSSGYCILYIHSLWNRGVKWGINWTCLQCKVYIPYPQLTEYMIVDPDEHHPANHYRDPKPVASGLPVTVLDPVPVSSILPVSSTLSVASTSTLSVACLATETVRFDEEHPEYGKFLKMKRVGLPDPVIQLKCQQEGYDWTHIQKLVKESSASGSTYTHTHTHHVATKTTPLVGIPGRMGGLSAITGDMLNGLKLKKIDTAVAIPQVQKADSEKVNRLKTMNKGFQPPSIGDIQEMLKRLRKPPSTEDSCSS